MSTQTQTKQEDQAPDEPWSPTRAARQAVRMIDMNLDLWSGRGPLLESTATEQMVKDLTLDLEQRSRRDSKLDPSDVTSHLWSLGLIPSWSPRDDLPELRRAHIAYRDAALRSLCDSQVYLLSPVMMDCVVAAAKALTASDLLGLEIPEDLQSGALVFPSHLQVRGVSAHYEYAAVTWNETRPGASGARGNTTVVRAWAHLEGPYWRLMTLLQWPDRQDDVTSASLAAARFKDETESDPDYDPSLGICNEDLHLKARLVAAFILLRQQADRTTDRKVPARGPGKPKKVSARKAKGRRSPDDLVTVTDISLRDDPDYGGTGEHRRVEWRHQWVVSMHKRRQPYGPGNQLTKIIFVGPYIKGPAGAPMKPRHTSVKAVVTPPDAGE